MASACGSLLAEHVLVESRERVGGGERAGEALGAIPERGVVRKLLRRAEDDLEGLGLLRQIGEDVEQALVLADADVRAGLAAVEEALQDVDAEDGILDGVERALEDLGGARGDLGITQEPRAELEGCRIVRRVLEDARDAVERLAAAARAIDEDGRDLHVERVACFAFGGGAPCGERGERALDVALGEREARDGDERLVVLGVGLADALVERERAFGIPELGLLDDGPRREHACAIVGAGARGAPFLEPADLGGARVARGHRAKERIEPVGRGAARRGALARAGARRSGARPHPAPSRAPCGKRQRRR